MATEEDNFDIDIYGDGGEDYHQEDASQTIRAEVSSDHEGQQPPDTTISSAGPPPPYDHSKIPSGIELENVNEGKDIAQKIASTDDSAADPVHLPKQAPQAQGLKRKDGAQDNRLVDPTASTALFVSELHWWVNDDDVRGWANQAQCEDELEDITFSEHKVNGKSKGQAFLLFKSPQAATAAKLKIESFGDGQQYIKKFTVTYTNPFNNPFRTLPKDGQMRNGTPASNHRSTPGGFSGSGGGLTHQNMGFNHSGGGYRGNRGGGYNNRSGGMNGMSGYNRGGFQQPMNSGFQGSMAGFQGSPMGAIPNYTGFQNRGGMMGGIRGGSMSMRGGRGGMSGNGMMGMPMNGMGMNPMSAMGINMPQMGGGMAIQGMQGSHRIPSMQLSGNNGSSASPAGHSASFASPAKQNPQGTVSSHFPVLRGGNAPETSSNPASVWANLIQYSSPAANSPSASFPCTVVHPAQSSVMLKGCASSIGQGTFQGAQTPFNPAIFNQGQHSGGIGDANWNPHGAKRTRQE